MKADIVLIAIIATALIIGYHKGFLKSLVNLLFMLFSTFGCYLLYPYISDILKTTPFYGNVDNYVVEQLALKYADAAQADNMASLFLKYNVSTAQDLIERMSGGITDVVINIVAAVIAFFLIRIIFFVLRGVFAFLEKIPVFHSLNGILGAAFTAFSALLIVFLFFAVILNPPCNESELSYVICDEVDNSFITKQLMEYNIFVNYDSIRNVSQVSFDNDKKGEGKE